MRLRSVLLYTPFLLLCLGLVAPSALAQEAGTTGEEQAAQEAAKAWLALIDAQDYAESWTQASKLLQGAVGQDQWGAAVQGAYAQMGVTKAPAAEEVPRDLVSTQYTETLPNAPKGEYVVLQYRTTYGGRQVIETVTMVKEDDAWKAGGYFVRPS